MNSHFFFPGEFSTAAGGKKETGERPVSVKGYWGITQEFADF